MFSKTRTVKGISVVVGLLLAVGACGGGDTAGTPITATTPSGGEPPSTSAPATPTPDATPEMPTEQPATPDATQQIPAEQPATPDDQGSHQPPAPGPTSSDQQATKEQPTKIAPAPESGTATALAGFFAAVSDTDQNLKEAAAAINASFDGDTVTFEQSTADLVDRAEPTAVAQSIPAGLDPATEQAVLLVYSDLVSRYASMSGLCMQVGTFTRAQLETDCFANGHVAAQRTDADVSSAHAAAAAHPSFSPAAPDSRQAAELQARIRYIYVGNLGCAGKGGFVADEAIVIDWNAEPSEVPEFPPLDGHINGHMGFRATYTADSGWTVHLNAC